MKLEDEELMKVMEIIAENKLLFTVHAENEITLDYLEDGSITRGSVGPEFFIPLTQR